MALSQPAGSQTSARGPHVRNPYSSLPSWSYPAFVVVALTLFGIFAVWVVFFQREGYYGPLPQPFSTRL